MPFIIITEDMKSAMAEKAKNLGVKGTADALGVSYMVAFNILKGKTRMLHRKTYDTIYGSLFQGIPKESDKELKPKTVKYAALGVASILKNIAGEISGSSALEPDAKLKAIEIVMKYM